MSPATATAGESRPSSVRSVLHPADMNGEERGDERQRPAAIDRRAHSFGGLDLRRHRRSLRVLRQTQLVDDRFVGFGGGVHRARR